MLPLTSPTSGVSLVGIVRSLTPATEFSLVFFLVPSKLSLGSPPYTNSIIKISYPYSIAWIIYSKKATQLSLSSLLVSFQVYTKFILCMHSLLSSPFDSGANGNFKRQFNWYSNYYTSVIHKWSKSISSPMVLQEPF
jgi:hypothetical protein